MASKNLKKVLAKIDAGATVSSASYPRNYERAMKVLARKARKVFDSGKATYIEAIPADEIKGDEGFKGQNQVLAEG